MSNIDKNKAELVKLFLCASRTHHRIFENKVSRFGVHRSQHRILMFLSKRQGMPTSQKDIADNFEISAAAVAVAVRKLEDGGFITRISGERDCRTNVIELTEQGQEIVEATKDIIETLDSAMFDGFDDGEIAEFCEYLTRLIDNAKNLER